MIMMVVTGKESILTSTLFMAFSRDLFFSMMSVILADFTTDLVEDGVREAGVMVISGSVVGEDSKLSEDEDITGIVLCF